MQCLIWATAERTDNDELWTFCSAIERGHQYLNFVTFITLRLIVKAQKDHHLFWPTLPGRGGTWVWGRTRRRWRGRGGRVPRLGRHLPDIFLSPCFGLIFGPSFSALIILRLWRLASSHSEAFLKPPLELPEGLFLLPLHTVLCTWKTGFQRSLCPSSSALEQCF